LKTHGQARAGFSLIEVMVAIAIFFAGLFAILGLVSGSLEGARHLERPLLDASVVASQISLTNKLVEGSSSGDLGELLGSAYSGCEWSADVLEVQSNKLFGVDIVLRGQERNKPVESKMTILLFRPQSPGGSLEGATTRR
jgi:hypothetical protein